MEALMMRLMTTGRGVATVAGAPPCSPSSKACGGLVLVTTLLAFPSDLELELTKLLVDAVKPCKSFLVVEVEDVGASTVFILTLATTTLPPTAASTCDRSETSRSLLAAEVTFVSVSTATVGAASKTGAASLSPSLASSCWREAVEAEDVITDLALAASAVLISASTLALNLRLSESLLLIFTLTAILSTPASKAMAVCA